MRLTDQHSRSGRGDRSAPGNQGGHRPRARLLDHLSFWCSWRFDRLSRLPRPTKKAFRSEREAQAPKAGEKIAVATCVVTNADLFGHSIGEKEIYSNTGVIVSRLLRGEAEQIVPTKYTVIKKGDLGA